MGSIITVPITFAMGLISVNPSDVVYWCKWMFSYIYAKINERFTPKRLDLYDFKALEDADKLGFTVPSQEFQLESTCSEEHLQKADDEIFCYGVNSKSECLIVSISRRSNQKADACIYLKLASGKTYALQKTDHFQQSCSDKNVFSCGDLQLSYTCPMRRWRIFYSGYLRETNDNDTETGRMVYVRFAFRWTASSDIFDCTSDIKPQILAQTLAKAEWESSYPPFDKLKNALNFYVQAGIIHGTVTVGDQQDEYEMYLFGQRIRYLGETTGSKDFQIDHMLGYIHQNGLYIYLAKASLASVANDSCFGFVVHTDCSLKHMKKASVMIKDSNDEKSLKATFQNGLSYKLSGSFSSPILQMSNKKGDGGTFFRKFDFYANGKKGTGVYITRKISEVSQQRISVPVVSKIPGAGGIEKLKFSLKKPPLAVSFSSEACQVSEITGGKGSSLGKLTKLSQDMHTFTVPSGIVVTTSAYKKFVTEDILAKIKTLEDVLYGKVEGNVKEVCESLRIEMENTEIPKGTREDIEMGLKRIFGENFHTLKFAIRSSATGEDTEQMSAAGQMDTFLGVLGLNEILHAVKKCWASQFGYVAIQYKRRYGQCLNSPMAVVIQEMVACDVAGVLFTCDPLTGNPTIMTITANYGLGESVVSGSEEPDTIELQRDPEDNLSIKSTNIGAKSRKIVVKDGEGTVLKDVSENEKSNCCLSEDMIMRLGQLGIEVERYYRSHRDIEWGFCNNQLYVFQSRPVTAGFNETVFEIDHEFDCPLRTENDFFSMANVGEVMPGAMSPLGQDYLCRVFDLIYIREKYQASYLSSYFRTAWVTLYNHMMFNVADVVPDLQYDDLDVSSRANLTSIFGKIIKDEDLSRVCRERYGDRKKEFSLLRMLKLLLMNSKHVQKEQKYYANFRIPVEKFKCSRELFDDLLRNCSYIYNICSCHMKISSASSVWNMLIFSILAKAKGEFNEDVYRDFASLITTRSDVESADVPSAIQSLAFHISKAINADEFKKMNVEEALNWLQRTSSTAGIKFREFLEKHGHRCLKECDVYSTPWGSEPKPLVKLLQSMAGSVSYEATKKQTDDADETFPQLSIPLGFFSRLLLKFLLPMSRRGVQNREMTKSILVRVVNEWRKGVRYLAKLMVSEGRIPDEDILYFMTLQEIKDLLDTRSPKILARAAQRQRRHPILDKYIFPEIMKGFPKPINLIETPIVSTDEHLMMKGVPVSQGVAEGFVRVAITLEEAAFLKPKEILVTYSTDIGWTPYFPTLAGVVTELGGLISHGAVVSREYGIPCIAAMYGATRRFQTGDYVRLDGNTGILQKIPPPEDM